MNLLMAIEEGNSVELLRISDLYLTRLIIHVKKILCPENEAAASFSGQPTIMSKSKNKIINVTHLVLTVADKVLLGLWDMFDDVSYGQIHPRLVLAVGARRAREIVAAKERFRQEREKKKALWQLRENKWIKQRKEGERIEYELTKNGRLAALEIIMRCTNSCLPVKETCLVIFDFPEAAKESRQAFRRLLRRIGFEFIQFSVWSSKKNIIFEIREVVDILKLGRWVKIYRGYED